MDIPTRSLAAARGALLAFCLSAHGTVMLARPIELASMHSIGPTSGGTYRAGDGPDSAPTSSSVGRSAADDDCRRESYASRSPDRIWGLPRPDAVADDDLDETLFRYLCLYKSRIPILGEACRGLSLDACRGLDDQCVQDLSNCLPASFEDIFIPVLGTLVERMSGDRLATSQAVWIYMRFHRPDLAKRTAEICTVSPGWCAMLEGVVAHEERRWNDARAAYERAIAALEPEDACTFTDLSWILEDAGSFGDLACADRGPAMDTVWWLADPLWSVPDNPRELAHYHRVATTILHDDYLELKSWPGSVVEWGAHPKSHHYNTLRMDYPRRAFDMSYFRTMAPGSGLVRGRSIWGGREYQFLPDRGVIEDPFHASPEGWNLDEDPPFELASDPTWMRFVPLTQQVAFFERGDQSLVVAGAELPFTSDLDMTSVRRAALVVSSGPGDSRITWDRATRDRYVLKDTVERRRHMVGVEVLADDLLLAGRAREGAGPPEGPDQRVRLSDLLLFRTDWAEGAPQDLDVAAEAMIGRSWVYNTEPIGAFWEIYGLDGEQAYDVSVQARRHVGFFGRLGRAIGFGSDDLVIDWTEGANPVEGITPRAVALSVAGMEPGDYTIEITVSAAGQLPVTASRRIEVR